MHISQLNFQGNIIPHSWYQTLKYANAKPNLNAITILSEIVYWYKPVTVLDEHTKQIIDYEQKFKEEHLQYSYEAFENKFGLSQKQVREALIFLEEKKIVSRVIKNIKSKTGMSINNVLYISLNITNLTILNIVKIEPTEGTLPFLERNPTLTAGEPSTSFEVNTNTKNTPQNTTESKIKDVPVVSFKQRVEAVVKKQVETSEDLKKAKQMAIASLIFEDEPLKIQDQSNQEIASIQPLTNHLTYENQLISYTDVSHTFSSVSELEPAIKLKTPQLTNPIPKKPSANVMLSASDMVYGRPQTTAPAAIVEDSNPSDALLELILETFDSDTPSVPIVHSFISKKGIEIDESKNFLEFIRNTKKETIWLTHSFYPTYWLDWLNHKALSKSKYSKANIKSQPVIQQSWEEMYGI